MHLVCLLGIISFTSLSWGKPVPIVASGQTTVPPGTWRQSLFCCKSRKPYPKAKLLEDFSPAGVGILHDLQASARLHGTLRQAALTQPLQAWDAVHLHIFSRVILACPTQHVTSHCQFMTTAPTPSLCTRPGRPSETSNLISLCLKLPGTKAAHM